MFNSLRWQFTITKIVQICNLVIKSFQTTSHFHLSRIFVIKAVACQRGALYRGNNSKYQTRVKGVSSGKCANVRFCSSIYCKVEVTSLKYCITYHYKKFYSTSSSVVHLKQQGHTKKYLVGKGITTQQVPPVLPNG